MDLRSEKNESRAWAELCRELADRADALDAAGDWPAEQLALCRKYGVVRWHIEREHGGLEWPEGQRARSLIDMAGACLSTTFALTQPIGFLRRVIDSANGELRSRVGEPVLSGEAFASVGISHLTTSRRHLSRPVMTAADAGDHYVVDGVIPWVTGSTAARWILTGAVLDDGRQILAALPTDLEGVEIMPPARMVALAATHTGEVRCHGVRLDKDWLAAGPIENVLKATGSAGTGGWQTSALATGVGKAAIAHLARHALDRHDLRAAAESLADECRQVEADVVAMAEGQTDCTAEDLRARSNSLALRASQAALTAAKGSGFVVGHAAGRWCREALFFLVWSCPQPVASAALCEFAGIGG